MTSRRTLTLLAALGILASCAATDTGCAGWRPIRVADATVDYLAANDRQTLAALIAHHEFGTHLNCW